MNEIIACPSCQRKVTVPTAFFGKLVQCPQCQRTFTAMDPSAAVQPAPPPSVSLAPSQTDGWDDAGSGPGPRAHRYEYDSADDFGFRRRVLRHRGPVVLTLGVLSLVVFFCAPVFGPIAWIMGHTDLKLMRAGQMERDGEGPTMAGMILGIVMTILAAVTLTLFCLGGLIDSLHRGF